MKQLALLLFVALLALPHHLLAQSKDTINIVEGKTTGYALKRKLFAIYCINKLKDGALLVRLKSRTKSAELYRSHGAAEVADRMLAEQRAENLLIANAFRKNFNFCKLYFFSSDNTDDLKNGKRSGYFLNDSLQVDTSIHLNEEFYMIAEFGPLEEESFEFPQEGGHPTSNLVNGNERYLVVRDNYFVQMRPPFPYAVLAKTIKFADRQAGALSNQFNDFYQKNKSDKPFYPFADITEPNH